MKRILIFLVAATIIGLSGCGNTTSENTSSKDTTSKQSLSTATGEEKDIKKLVQNFIEDKMVKEQTASITATELIVTNSDDSQLTYALPEDEFFVSIAPYIEQTHRCTIHSLTGCVGELKEEEFEIYLEDSEGNVIIDKVVKSNSRGFIDLWVPRNTEFTINISNDGKQAQSQFSTFEQDGTCITTIQLK